MNLPKKFLRGLSSRYRLERELGRGGMATVYLAHDLQHDRPVALKVLNPELAYALGAARFQREITLAARLDHPHILPVLDSGQTESLLWYTMPYVEGESLRDLLHREVQLPLDQAVRIARDVADALEWAHKHGIVHRDIKPENILLSHAHARVADFGLARALEAAGGDKLTDTGIAVGTPAYMSPEQASGDAHLEGRSDLYSLGCVLYEMLAGEPPFTGATSQAVIAKRFAGPPPSVRITRPDVSAALEAILTKALAQVPAARFGTAGDLVRALEQAEVTASGPRVPRSQTARGRFSSSRLAGLATIALAVIVGGIVLTRARTQEAGEAGDVVSGPKRLAVIPFENLGRPDQEHFADGITDEVRGKLAALTGLQVTARSSSSQYKKVTKSPQQIGQELGVQYLLTGTVHWMKDAGGQSWVRVSPELVQVATASTSWQAPFEAPLTDVFQVQADIAGRVAEALDIALGASERKRLAEEPTHNLTAYDAYLKGEEVSNAMGTTDPATLHRALGHYEKAVVLDSAFALAWARLSQAHALLYFLTPPTLAEGEAARAAAERALALAPKRQEGQLALGDYHYRVTHDYSRALEHYSLGRQVAPRDVDLLVGTALTEQSLRRWETSLQHLQQAQTLDPRSVNTTRRLARTLLWLRRYPEALRVSDRGLALAPASLELLEHKAMVHLAQGDLAKARAVLRAAPKEIEPEALVAFVATYWDLVWVLDQEQHRLLVRLSPGAFDNDRANWAIVLAQTHALRGDRVLTRAYADSARLAFEEQLREVPGVAVRHLFFGLALAYSGRKAEAVREGKRGLALQPVAQDAYLGASNQHQLARIYLLVGEPEKALDQLEPLLRMPYYLSPGWLEIDPTFAPLRGHPRFERLLRGS